MLRHGRLGILLIIFFLINALPPAALVAVQTTPGEIQAIGSLGELTEAQLTLINDQQHDVTLTIHEQRWQAEAPRQRPAGPLRVKLPEQEQRIDPQLEAELEDGGRADMLIFLGEQADLSAAAAVRGWEARGQAVYTTLVEHAERTQAPLRAWLESRGIAYQPLWIVNGLRIQADAATARELAGRAEVALLRANRTYAMEHQPGVTTNTEGWNIGHIGADEAWSMFSVRGEGIVVANIDTGVDWEHPALQSRYRGADGNHSYAWFDGTTQPISVPFDYDGHGTHTMGTMIAGPSTGHVGVGVAPGARWIAGRGCRGNFCEESALIASAQWMLAPTDTQGQNPRPDLRPHIINNSWGGIRADRWYIGYVEAWRAAGIFPAFAAGNQGYLGCSTIAEPGAYAESVTVGAVDIEDRIASFSARGPAPNGLIKPDIVAPGVGVISTLPEGGYGSLSGTSMATPHVAGLVALLWSANPQLLGDLSGTYEILRSTALGLASSDCGGAVGAVPNNLYGWGRINALAAVAAASPDVPWLSVQRQVTLPAGGSATLPVRLDGRLVPEPGIYQARLMITEGSLDPQHATVVSVTFDVQMTADAFAVHGTLRNHWTGDPVFGSVSVIDGPTITTSAEGAYHLTLRAGSYMLRGSAAGYLPHSEEVQIARSTMIDLALMPDQPHMAFSSPTLSATLGFAEEARIPITISNEGVQPLSVTVTVPPMLYSLERGVTGGASGLYSMAHVTPTLLEDDGVSAAMQLGFSMPAFGALRDHVYISSNGWISLAELPPKTAAAGVRCDFASLPQATFAALWMDLNPEVEGWIRASQVDADTFVVSYEGLPLFTQEPEVTQMPTYTFQIALHESGIVEYLYGELGALPMRYAAGWRDVHPFVAACGDQGVPPISGETFLLEAQPNSQSWLIPEQRSVTVAPSTSATVMMMLRGPTGSVLRTRPYLGQVLLLSNDPLLPWAALEAQLLRVGPEPLHFYTPILRR